MKTIWLLDRPQYRVKTPCATAFYRALAADPRYDVWVIEDFDSKIEDIEAGLGHTPDIVMSSFLLPPNLWAAKHWLEKNQVTTIIETGDPHLFMIAEKASYLATSGVHIDMMITHTTEGWDHLVTAIEKWPDTFGECTMTYIPWVIDESLYTEYRSEEKKYDLAVMASMTDYNIRVGSRYEYMITASRLKRRGFNVFTSGKLFMEEQRRVLGQSKMVPVDSLSKDPKDPRRYLTQRYLETPMCGALILGEQPGKDGDDLCVDGETMVVVNDWTHDFEGKFELFQEESMLAERTVMVRNMQQRIREKRHPQVAVEAFAEAI